MDSVLRIPLTAAQKQIIADAAGADASGNMATWAREVLLDAARKALRSGARTGTPKGG